MTTIPITIKIDNVEYVRADSIPTPPPTGDLKIVVLKDRWNLVGTLSETKDGQIVMADAKVIRYWGTTAGLGQLAKDGPTTKTILDPLNQTTQVNPDSVLFLIDCDRSKW